MSDLHFPPSYRMLLVFPQSFMFVIIPFMFVIMPDTALATCTVPRTDCGCLCVLAMPFVSSGPGSTPGVNSGRRAGVPAALTEFSVRPGAAPWGTARTTATVNFLLGKHSLRFTCVRLRTKSQY